MEDDTCTASDPIAHTQAWSDDEGLFVQVSYKRSDVRRSEKTQLERVEALAPGNEPVLICRYLKAHLMSVSSPGKYWLMVHDEPEGGDTDE